MTSFNFAFIFLVFLKKHYSSKEKNNDAVAIPTLDGANSEENRT